MAARDTHQMSSSSQVMFKYISLNGRSWYTPDIIVITSDIYVYKEQWQVVIHNRYPRNHNWYLCIYSKMAARYTHKMSS
jgi:hypothetical protein